LLHRDPFAFDFDRVISEAVKRGVWLEINSSPERLDLSANHVRAAKAKGAKFIVSTDAHHPKHLLNLKYGILTARRGGLTAADVVNTKASREFLQ
jgi:DNA polymerase (family 10)